MEENELDVSLLSGSVKGCKLFANNIRVFSVSATAAKMQSGSHHKMVQLTVDCV